jgi:hypothetical protein
MGIDGVARITLGLVGIGACVACVKLPFTHGAGTSLPSVRQAAGPNDTVPNLDQLAARSLLSPKDAVVRVVAPGQTCSGTLIDEDLVLTAHHCVVERGSQGQFTTTILKPSQMQVQLGGDFLPIATKSLKWIVAPSCGEAGGRGDVAVLVLESRVVGFDDWKWSVTDEAPRQGELVRPFGFGRCALSSEGVRRRDDREGGEVTSLDSGTFEAQASVCPGDSGGPVVDPRTCDRNGKCTLMGVVSLSAMDHDESTRGRTVFARIDEMHKVISAARAVADAADPTDVPPVSCEP